MLRFGITLIFYYLSTGFWKCLQQIWFLKSDDLFIQKLCGEVWGKLIQEPRVAPLNYSSKKLWGWFSKITRVIYTKNSPNQTCDYSLITPNQRFVLKLLSFNSGQVQNNINVAMSITIIRVINFEINLIENAFQPNGS